MLKTQLRIDTSALERLEKADFMAAIARGAEKGMLETSAHIKRAKLSGQLLNVRTGALRGSIIHKMGRKGDKITASIGSPLPYARIHELGYKGPMQVKAHGRTVRKVFGRTLSTPITINVRAHTRNVDIKARKYLRSGLMDKLDTIYRHITREIMRAA